MINHVLYIFLALNIVLLFDSGQKITFQNVKYDLPELALVPNENIKRSRKNNKQRLATKEDLRVGAFLSERSNPVRRAVLNVISLLHS